MPAGRSVVSHYDRSPAHSNQCFLPFWWVRTPPRHPSRHGRPPRPTLFLLGEITKRHRASFLNDVVCRLRGKGHQDPSVSFSPPLRKISACSGPAGRAQGDPQRSAGLPCLPQQFPCSDKCAMWNPAKCADRFGSPAPDRGGPELSLWSPGKYLKTLYFNRSW